MRPHLVAALALAPALAAVPVATASPTATPPPACTAVGSTFGRMLPNLPPARWPTADVNALAAKVMAPEETDPTPEGQVDDEENADIDAGYTYFGQLIDHDLTLDDNPNDLTTPMAPESIPNSRTPAFDLDSLYGAGPAGSPQLYDADGMHMRLGAPLTGAPSDPGAVDLPRDPATGQALIGDPRDDENRMVAGLQEILLRFHNHLVDRLVRDHPSWPAPQVLAEAQRQVRWYYQWAVLTDFLPTVVGKPALSAVFGGDPRRPHLSFYNPCRSAMPVEFSVAAYRFGHSMVRPIYRLNATMPARLPVFSLSGDPNADVGGFRPAPSGFAIDWKFFFPMEPRQVGVPQASYRMDNSLVFPLSILPLAATGTGPATLATRNLLRSEQVGLPSGQDVARAMGQRPLRDDQILIGKATGDPADAVPITDVSPAFAGKAPLWTYVLAEATANAFRVRNGRIVGGQVAPFRLGPVGGRIVAETFAGLMLVDRTSVLYARGFRPDPALAPSGRFGVKELIQAAIAPDDAGPVPVKRHRHR